MRPPSPARSNEQEPITFTPVECYFPPGVNYKTFEYKWKGEAKNPWVKVQDAELSRRIQEMTRNMYLAMDGEGTRQRCGHRHTHTTHIQHTKDTTHAHTRTNTTHADCKQQIRQTQYVSSE